MSSSSAREAPFSLANRGPGDLPGLSLQNGFQFRHGQHVFLEKLADALRRGEPNHLGVFVPGYGKTITALAAFVIAHHLRLADKLVVFVPRGNLRDQYADAGELAELFRNIGAPSFSFCVADSERVFLKNLDTQIIITTYQYASGRGGHHALLRFCQSARCMFVFDEVHHLSDDGLWASKIQAFPSTCSVALSGTPMRSDNKTLFGVPFVVHEDGQQYYVALHEVTMRDAHEEGKILKRVEAHVVDYKLKMVRADTGQVVELSLSRMAELAKTNKEVDAFLARKKLRFHHVYLDNLLRPAFERFAEKRRKQQIYASQSGQRVARNHQMLIIAMSNRHAAAMLEFIREQFPQFSSGRIGQDVPAQERETLLEGYRNGSLDVMVQVDMIGEGTDIKPISVIVKADLVRAYSKTLQQVFRGMRFLIDFGPYGNVCDIYAANDSEVVQTLAWISSEEQMGIKLKQQRENQTPPSKGASEYSPWELTDVQRRDMRTHTMDLFSARQPVTHHPPPLEQAKLAVDVRKQEQELRKSCASLATELAFMMQSHGRTVEVRQIHAEAKRRFSKAQEDLSLNELQRKQEWLERCLHAGRMV